jgi:hypothetical protein
MKNALLALAAVAVALPAVPADAQRGRHAACAKWRHGHCVAWKSKNAAKWRVGHRFGPRYAYTSFGRIPRTYVVRYDLSPRYRYVYADNYIYVVDPKTYAIERIIYALAR